jgi:hypothetical protein
MSDKNQHCRKKPKVMDFNVFKDAPEVLKNQNDETEKYMHINGG